MLAGGEPKYFRIASGAARFILLTAFASRHHDDIDAAMFSASRAPACNASLLSTNHAANPSGVPDANPRAAAR